MFSRRKSSSPACSPLPASSSPSPSGNEPSTSSSNNPVITTTHPEAAASSSSKFLPPAALDYNPISDFYHLGKLIGTAGPELGWRIFDANKKDDGQEAAIFFFDKRWAERRTKPKRREQIVDVLRRGVINLTSYCSANSRLLEIWTPLQETSDTMAFATEPVLGSLANILGYLEDRLRQGVPSSLRLITFDENEHCSGISQISEALEQLHYDQRLIHRNICPQSVIVSKSGIWKLAGMEFVEKCSPSSTNNCDIDNVLPVNTTPFTSKMPKMCQPDLDYVAPEMQSSSAVSPQSDIFSLGLLICSIFNNGRSPIEANFSTEKYFKSLENLSQNVQEILERIPNQLSKHIESMLEAAPRKRPTTEHFVLIPYFREASRVPIKFKLSIEAPSPSCPWLADLDDVHSSFKRSSLGDATSSKFTSSQSKLNAILSASNTINNNDDLLGSPRRASVASLLMSANSVDSSDEDDDDDERDINTVTAAFLSIMDQSKAVQQRRHSDNSISIPQTFSNSTTTSPIAGNSISNIARSISPSLAPTLGASITHARSTSSLVPPRGRRHSSINPHDISRFATKLVDSAAESVQESVEKASKATTSGMHLGLETIPVVTGLSPLPSPTTGRRGSRRCSVADIAEMIVPVGLASSSSQAASGKSPKPSRKKMFKKLGSEMIPGNVTSALTLQHSSSSWTPF